MMVNRGNRLKPIGEGARRGPGSGGQGRTSTILFICAMVVVAGAVGLAGFAGKGISRNRRRDDEDDLHDDLWSEGDTEGDLR